jgi:hypothetical protein
MLVYKKFIKFGQTGDEKEVNSRTIPAYFTPSNYIPTQVGSEADFNISAHLKGIDMALANAEIETRGVVALNNNQSSATNITELLFNGAVVRSVAIEFSIDRATSANEKASSGLITLTYNSRLSNWSILIESDNSNAGIVFDCTTGGQIQYTSDNLTGSGYIGQMRFSYTTFLV